MALGESFPSYLLPSKRRSISVVIVILLIVISRLNTSAAPHECYQSADEIVHIERAIARAHRARELGGLLGCFDEQVRVDNSIRRCTDCIAHMVSLSCEQRRVADVPCSNNLFIFSTLSSICCGFSELSISTASQDQHYISRSKQPCGIITYPFAPHGTRDGCLASAPGPGRGRRHCHFLTAQPECSVCAAFVRSSVYRKDTG